MHRTLIVTILIIVLAALGVFIPSAHAHILKTDNSIGVLFHLTPDDDPIIGVKSDFFFDIKDKNNKFTTTDCVCMITIKKEEKIYLQQQITTRHEKMENMNTITSSFIFPEKGIYEITLHGSPRKNQSFNEFNIRYEIRVAREQTSNPHMQDQPIQIGIGIFIAILLLIFLAIVFIRKPKSRISLFIIVTLLLSHIAFPLNMAAQNHFHSQTISHESVHPCCLPVLLGSIQINNVPHYEHAPPQHKIPIIKPLPLYPNKHSIRPPPHS